MRDAGSTLSPDELQRYHRQLILPDIGEEGQLKVARSRVLLLGAGGLGSPVALYLAAAGVGHIGIIDEDVVDLSNLHRQVIHGTRDVGRPKVASAADALRDLNPHVDVAAIHARLSSSNAMELLRGYDVVVDGSDNFPTRYLVNDACVLLGIPCVHASISRFDGQASIFATAEGPCYRCLFPEPPAPGTIPNCAEGGVFGVLPGLLGAIQATETIKLITGVGESLVGRLLVVDALRMRFRTIELERNPSCPACGTHTITELIDYDAFCGVSANSRSEDTQVLIEDESTADEITPQRLHARIRAGDAITLLDVRETYEWAIARLPDARLIPLGSLPRAVNTLDRSAETVVYCHHGTRSAAAVAWLRDQGFSKVLNLVGGIDRWSIEVDHTVRRY